MRAGFDILKRDTAFQFHSGSIKSFLLKRSRAVGFGFNSIVVRLKAIREKPTAFALPRFNSIVVRLKGPTASSTATALGGFNSIVVRLKAARLPSGFAANPPFQFHSGSIKSRSGGDSACGLKPSFNSIVVRLKARCCGSSTKRTIRFQFHSGSIKSAPGKPR